MTPVTEPDAIPKRILIPRFDSLGDLVLLEGFLEALQGLFPEAKLTLLVRRVYCDLAPLFPDTLEWLPTDIDPHRQAPDLSLCRALLEDLGQRSWDLLLVTAHNRTWAESLVAACLAESSRWAIGDEVPLHPHLRALLHDLQPDSDLTFHRYIPVTRDCHEVEKYALLWAALSGAASPLPDPRLCPNEYQLEAGGRILTQAGFGSGEFCMCFPAGTQKVAVKAWPPDRFAEVVAWLERARGVRSLVSGHRSESDAVHAVAELSRERGAHPGIWLGRDGEIPLLAALIRSARLYVGNDTGPMHMAAALRTPVVAVFGGGTWPRFLPRGRNNLAIAGDMPCFGCGWDCIFEDAPCMRLPSVEDVERGIEFVMDCPEASGRGTTVRGASGRLSEDARSLVGGAVRSLARMRDLMAEIDKDRQSRLELIGKLSSDIEVIEKDRAARLELIERLSGMLKATQTRLEMLRRNIVVKVLLKSGLISGWDRVEPGQGAGP